MVRNNKTTASFYCYQTTASAHSGPVYNGLLAQDPLDPTSEKIVPELADRWEISGDGLTYTFFLHQGIKWSDGVPFTSADVKYDFNLIRNPPTGFASVFQNYFDAVASIEAPNDYTVVVKMSRISQSIISSLAETMVVTMPKHLIEKDVLHAMDNVMVGTGPYLFKKLTPDQILVYERNPQYWKPGLPYLDGIQIIPIVDNNAYIAALYTGQIDTYATGGARTVMKTDALRVQKERPELLHEGSVVGFGAQTLLLNTKMAPFQDQRVRVAVQDSIDRVEVEKTGSSMGQVGGWKPPGSFWALPVDELAKLPGFGPDISARRAQARQLLKDAGIAAGTTITLSTKSNNPFQVEVVELIQLQLQQALPSLSVKIRNYPSAEFDALEVKGDLHAWFATMNIGVDPDSMAMHITTTGSRNTTGISDPRIDELQLKQSTILNPAQRRLTVWELDKLVIQNGATVPLHWKVDVCLAQRYVKNEVCAAFNKGIGGRYEIVWLDK